MKKLKIMSIDLTTPRLSLSRKKKGEEIKKYISKEVFEGEDIISAILLQGDESNQVAKELNFSDYQLVTEEDNAAILVHNNRQIAGWFSISDIGSAVVIPAYGDFLTLFSVTMKKKKDLDKFVKEYEKFQKFDAPCYTKYHVIGGKFRTLEERDKFALDYGLIDSTATVGMSHSEVYDDPYSILITDNLDSEASREVGLVKKKVALHCPAITTIKANK